MACAAGAVLGGCAPLPRQASLQSDVSSSGDRAEDAIKARRPTLTPGGRTHNRAIASTTPGKGSATGYSRPMEYPREMDPPPSIWVPVRARTQILLPFNPSNIRANPQWLREVLGDRIQIHRGHGGAWEIARNHSDELLRACVERFGPGKTTVITDAAQQQKCGPLCQNGKPENALNCQCQCGGANHGGAGGWKLYDDFAIHTDEVRRVFKV